MQKQLNEIRVEVHLTIDIVTARQQGRELALELGFTGSEITLIAAAISEIARNILDHAKRGEVLFSFVHHGTRHGLQVMEKSKQTFLTLNQMNISLAIPEKAAVTPYWCC